MSAPAGFDRPPLLLIREDGRSFEVWDAVVYTGSLGDAWRVPVGYVTDLATIPDALSWAVPKLGSYSLAAIVHDVLCDELAYWHTVGRYRVTDAVRPQASAVDADAIFRKIARENGTDPVTAAVLWTGVRWGALANPSRREGWLRTAPAVLGYSVLLAPVLLPATVLAVLGSLVLRAARSALRLFGR